MSESVTFLIEILQNIKNRDDKSYKNLMHLLDSYTNKKCDYFTFLCNVCQILNSYEIQLLNKLFPPFLDIYKIIDKNPCIPKTKRNSKNLFKDGTYENFVLFDQIKKILTHNDVYENFMKCIQLFLHHCISADELLVVTNSFIGKSPILFSEFKQLIGKHLNIKPQLKRKRNNNYEIDFSSCRKIGHSYRELPLFYETDVCSGRTELCNQVLNNCWVSFPSWSEDIPSTYSRISAYQEFVYRCEDERYELDIVIDNVKSVIDIFEDLNSKMNKMSSTDLSKFQLDDQLGGNSVILQKKVIERIYGDRANDIIEGIKHKPTVAIPIALRRLKTKLIEFEEHRIQFNKIWKEQTERQTQRAISSEINATRLNDLKETRSKVILNVAEVLQAESDELSKIYGEGHSIGRQHYVFHDSNCATDATKMLKYDLRCLASLESDDSLIDITHQMLDIFHCVLTSANNNKDAITTTKNLTLYLNGYWYVVFNLHNKLSNKLFEIKEELANLKKESSEYESVLSALNEFISGAMDVVKLEHAMKTKFNLKIANNALACDKLLQSIVRQLQLVSKDEASQKIIDYFLEYRLDDISATDNQHSFNEAKYAAYTKKIVQLLDDEYCFKLNIETGNKEIFCQMVDTDIYMEENGVANLQWQSYLHSYLHDDDNLKLIDSFYESRGIKNKLFLNRNINFSQDRSNCLIVENDEISFPQLSYKFSYSISSGFFLRKFKRKKNN